MFSKELFGLDKNGGFKVWKIVVREYLDPVEDATQVVIEVYHGKEGGKIQKKVEFVNVGKQGRTPYEQGVSQAEGKIKKQVDKGYREDKAELTELPLLAMLAHDFHKQGHRIEFPCRISYKFDGVRSLAKCTEAGITLESRTGQPYDVPHIVAELAKYMKPGDVLDGELYLHGYELQDITSAVKRTDTQAEIDKALRKLDKAEKSGNSEEIVEANLELNEAVLIHNLRPRLEFHVFDVPSDLPFEDRYASLIDMAQEWDKGGFIHYVQHEIINHMNHVVVAHAEAVANGYEGIMFRNLEGMYESGKRSADLQKYKTFLDSEFKILDVIPDKDGHAVFVLQNDLKDNTFTCVYGSHDDRAWQLVNKRLLVGMWLKVKYQSRYKGTLIPQFPTGVCIRSCDADGNPVE